MSRMKNKMNVYNATLIYIAGKLNFWFGKFHLILLFLAQKLYQLFILK